MKRVYLDNAATTRLHPSVLEEMLPYFTQIYGNPSSLHTYAQQAKHGLDRARDQVAAALKTAPGQIIFTGSGTEADNLAIKGTAELKKAKGKHIITSAVEHHAVLHSVEKLEKDGFEATYLPVDEHGLVSPDALRRAIREDTILVTIMFANNEVGTIMPIAELGAICRERGVLFHTDAVQAVGSVDIDVSAMNIDMLSLSAHKLHGPKGVGALYVKKGLRLPPLIHGGAQENKRRAGTENVPGIVGLGKAIELATADIPGRTQAIRQRRDRLMQGIAAAIPQVKLNGHPTLRLPGNVNFSIRYIEGESILLMLDLQGIAASSGSACTSGSLDPSHVLLAMGLSHEVAHGSLRLTLSDETGDEDVDYVVSVLPGIVAKLRDMSPLYKGDK